MQKKLYQKIVCFLVNYFHTSLLTPGGGELEYKKGRDARRLA